jgi:spore maturation protein A
MQQLQSLNHKKDQASDAMCMFLALNTSSVQLLPPVTLIALMGVGVSSLLPAIILATLASTVAAIISVKLYSKLGSR